MNTLKLAGISHLAGGDYENVQVEGIANIDGTINCAGMRIEGVSNINGNLNCEDLTIEGTCKIKGKIKSLKCHLSGLLTAEGLDAEAFDGSGSFQIEGGINAEKVDVRFVYGSAAEEVCGEQIRINKEDQNGAVEFVLDLIPWRHKGKSFRCNLIEGDQINISHTDAAVVRGRCVTIGPECQVELAEYHEEIEIHPKARVSKTVKLGG